MVEGFRRRAQDSYRVNPDGRAAVECRSFACRDDAGGRRCFVPFASVRLELILDEERLVGSWSYAVECPECGEEVRGRLADVYGWALAGVGCALEVF